jgi:hypothetical protein
VTGDTIAEVDGDGIDDITRCSRTISFLFVDSTIDSKLGKKVFTLNGYKSNYNKKGDEIIV